MIQMFKYNFLENDNNFVKKNGTYKFFVFQIKNKTVIKATLYTLFAKDFIHCGTPSNKIT